MDPDTLAHLGGWIGGIGGSALGLLGGILGTYASIKKTEGPRERAFVIKVAILCWILVTAFLVALLTIPTWHRHLLWIPYALLLSYGVRTWNKAQLRLRTEEAAQLS